jgi:Right handed beta helix region
MQKIGMAVLLSLLTLIPVTAGHGPAAALADARVPIFPTDDPQAVVDANPAGTHFVIKAGTHHHFQVTPRDDDIFEGEPGAVLTGAAILPDEDWIEEIARRRWYIANQTQQSAVYGECAPAHPRCGYNEWVFRDNAPLEHVATLEAVTAGAFFHDQAADRIYVGDDPVGHRMEVLLTPWAFDQAGANVTIKGDADPAKSFIVEKYASPNQNGAIRALDWSIDNVEVRWNHGAGVEFDGPGGRIRGCYVHHNGMGGITTDQMHDGEIRGCESEGHGWNGIDPWWEAGWGKIWQADGVLIRGNYVHDDERGIWTDDDNINIVIEYNVCVDNQWEGIKVEIGYDTIVRYNISMGNGIIDDTFFFDSQIVVQNSQKADVHDNFVRVSSGFGSSIGIIEQDRSGFGPETYGPYISDFPNIHDNVIVFDDVGDVGAVHDVTPPRSDYYDNITFRGNHYHFVEASPNTDRFNWDGSLISWAAWQAAGNDTTGSLTTSSDPSPPAPTMVLASTPLDGGRWRLEWEALRATAVAASGGWSGNRRLWGQEIVTPLGSNTYTLTATGPGGSHAQSVTLP